jgi:hypothetical protein
VFTISTKSTNNVVSHSYSRGSIDIKLIVGRHARGHCVLHCLYLLCEQCIITIKSRDVTVSTKSTNNVVSHSHSRGSIDMKLLVGRHGKPVYTGRRRIVGRPA